MFDHEKLDSYFSSKPSVAGEKNDVTRHTQIIRMTKLLLPSIAALLVGLLILFPSLKQTNDEFAIDITYPKKGELEKLHMENTIFYITDKDNKVNNFTADKVDETEPGSKLVKLTNPDGVLPSANETWINIKSPIGFYNQDTSVLNLIEDVNVFYSDGMTAQSEEVNFDFKANKGYGNKPITATGTFGDLQSQGFEFYSNDGLLIFTGKTYITVEEDSLKGNNNE